MVLADLKGQPESGSALRPAAGGSLMEAWWDAAVLQRHCLVGLGGQGRPAPGHAVDARLCRGPAGGAARVLLKVASS